MSVFARISLLVLALGIGAAPPAHAQDRAPCDLMIDNSGSMKGYRAAAQQPLMQLIDDLRQRCAKSYLFGDGEKIRPLDAGKPVTFSDQNTNLGPNLKDWIAGAQEETRGTDVVAATGRSFCPLRQARRRRAKARRRTRRQTRRWPTPCSAPTA